MRGEHHVALPCEEADRFREVIRPGLCVTHQCAARGQQVVHAEVRVLCHEDGAVVRQVEVHLGRRFRARRDLEDHAHIADGQFLPRMRDVDGRRDERWRTHGRARAEARRCLAAAAMLQRQAELVARAAEHCGPGDDVLRHGFLQEARRRDDRDLARCNIAHIRHAAHARIMVGMAVRIDDRDDGLFAQMLGHEFIGRARRLDTRQRIDHDPALSRIDEGHRRDAEAAHLIDAVHHLEEPVLGQDLCLAAQARVHGLVGLVVLEIVIGGEVEGGAVACVARDHRVLSCGDEAAFGEFEIAAVIGGDELADLFKSFAGGGHVRSLGLLVEGKLAGAPSFDCYDSYNFGSVRHGASRGRMAF